MFCGNCGKSVEEDSVFCEFCGAKINKTKPQQPVHKSEKTETPTEVLSENKTKEESPYSDEELRQIYYYSLLINQAKRTANAEMLKGIGWAALGGLITFITYTMASDGGTYFVLWGLVIYGAYVFFKGLYYRLSPKSLLEKAYEGDSGEDDKNDN